MTETDFDYDQRQYERMMSAIRRYQKESQRERDLSGLRVLIEDLSALRWALRNPAAEWMIEFEPEWAALEEVYASMLYEEKTRVDDIGYNIIEEAIRKLIPLIESKMQK